MSRKCIDLTGQKFGRLTVIKRAMDKKYSIPYWVCQCECGNTKIIRGSSLKSGATQSCGCFNKEKTSEAMKKLNEKQWKNENFRQVKSEQMKQLNEEQWQDEDFRQMQKEKIKKQWQDEDFKQMQVEKMKEQWKNEEIKWKMGYRGGITPISMYLRDMQIVKQWRKDTYIRENSKCQLTGNHVHGGNSDVHHLKGFNTIVKEAHDLHNIQIKEIVANYTEEELRLLEEYIVKWHKDTANAVLLSDKIHSLFHSTYGSGNNTPEQFEEFKERYLAGEFKEILK